MADFARCSAVKSVTCHLKLLNGSSGELQVGFMDDAEVTNVCKDQILVQLRSSDVKEPQTNSAGWPVSEAKHVPVTKNPEIHQTKPLPSRNSV